VFRAYIGCEKFPAGGLKLVAMANVASVGRGRIRKRRSTGGIKRWPGDEEALTSWRSQVIGGQTGCGIIVFLCEVASYNCWRKLGVKDALLAEAETMTDRLRYRHPHQPSMSDSLTWLDL
jgi:hypothetical protein